MISVVASVGSALHHTFIANKSKMEIEPVLVIQTNAMPWRVAGLVNYA
jgi:hypothetical protein